MADLISPLPGGQVGGAVPVPVPQGPDEAQEAVDLIQRIGIVPKLLDVCCRVTGMGFAAVARVTETHWIAAQVLDQSDFGLKAGGQLKVDTTICHEIRSHRTAVVIDDVSQDPAYAAHHTPAIYGLQSYIAMPIILSDGTFYGTLCAVDAKPHRLNTPEVTGLFTLFAELLAFHIDAQRRAVEQDETGALRERFIAVLGHDLRNPLASLDAGTRMLAKTELTPRAKGVVELMRASIERMSGLIDNMLDFARGRLGSGLALDETAPASLAPALGHVIEELRLAHPSRRIEAQLTDLPVRCDAGRVSQLLSNLLANAIAHGAADLPVSVEASVTDSRFSLSVTNGGPPIPPELQQDLFKPFVRMGGNAGGNGSGAGLGLGLFIAAEIAKAHGGTISVASDARETRFTFSMPHH
ncbi:GAF domain-containing sensor histidine kinase [Rhizobium rhizosphaerae]|uniref:GAF domain-containing sensor histidine kinase n=1 Tax=Xaviernesmea rhizosphaerae TaxID=1672749 RepID=UPI0009C17EBA|nr:HAMP domain-containing sensor histidine kinase [Xaviernesmea rhizosphaerae]